MNNLALSPASNRWWWRINNPELNYTWDRWWIWLNLPMADPNDGLFFTTFKVFALFSKLIIDSDILWTPLCEKKNSLAPTDFDISPSQPTCCLHTASRTIANSMCLQARALKADAQKNNGHWNNLAFWPKLVSPHRWLPMNISMLGGKTNGCGIYGYEFTRVTTGHFMSKVTPLVWLA